MTADEQLALWLVGESVCPNDRDECCPDFSCCCKEIETPQEVKQRFVDGDDNVRHQMCMMFLGNALPHMTDKKVHIAGDEPTELS